MPRRRLRVPRPPIDAANWADFRQRLHEVDLVVDLGANIGSRDWWRGLFTCVGLCGLTASFAPGIPTLDVPAAPAMGEAQYQEARADGFAPLAYGADTGRRMGATALVEPLADTPERPSIELAATLGRGDGFVRALERNGVSSADAIAAADLVARAVPLTAIAAGTRVDMTLGRRARKDLPRPLDHMSFRAAFDMRLAVERRNGALTLVRHPIAVDDTPLRVQGRVGSSLYRSARAAGAPASAIEAYLKAIASRISIGSIPSSARFDIIVAQRRAETGEVETGGLLLAGLERGNKKDLRLMKWTAGGRDAWFDGTGTGETRGAMKQPVVGRLTSSFGLRRHPLLGFSRMHRGMDFGAPMGSPILAATDGTVAFAGWHGGHGKYVRLNHPGSMATGYAHMSRIVAKPGQKVRQGQVIGYVGSTGLSTGPHLHYEVFKGGQAINPASLKFSTTTKLAGGDLSRFRARMASLLGTRIGGPAKPVETAKAKADAPGTTTAG